jgi:prephenate dehydrogenase
LTVGIIGLGLMGGSLGLELKKASFGRVIGYNRNPKHNEQALNLGLVDEVVDIESLKQQSDIIILAIPVDAIIKTLETLKDVPQTTTIIDLGSTKKTIIDTLPNSLKSNFIPAHPMCGTEFFGPTAAMYDLYKESIVVLCDIEQKHDIHKQRAMEIFNLLQMNIVYMPSNEHDVHAAYISHLPHIISYSLANAVMIQEDPKSIIALAAGGFRDMSRIAKSSPRMWRDIFKHNKDNLLQSIMDYRVQMDKAIALIKDENWDELEEWMSEANTLHDIL